jgi:HlyD family secretion protein
MKKVLIIAGCVLIVLAAGYFLVLPRIASAASTGSSSESYQTSAATLGSLTTTVSGTGNVYPKQSTTIKWQTSGTVGTVKVKQGDQVAAGAVLSTLDPNSLSLELINAQIDLSTAKKNLESVLDNTQARADAEAALVSAEEALKTAQEDSTSMQFQRASQDQIDIAKASVIIAEQNVTKAQKYYDDVSKHTTDPNYVVNYANALSQLANARISLQTANYQLSYLENLPNLTDIEQMNAELDQAKATLLKAKQAWDQVKDGPNPDDVAAAQAKVAAAQAIVNEAQLSAPFAGTITDVYDEVGSLVSSGTSAYVIQDQSKMLIDVSVSEVDIAGVEVGQPAVITFDAISDKTYTGIVDSVASTGNSSSGSVNYTVTVSIDNPDSRIKSGMSASVDIAVKQLTNILLVPISAVRTLNNARVVYVLRNNIATPVEVTLGETSDTEVQIASGDVKEGDLIILNASAATTTTTTQSSSFLGGLFGGLFGGSTGTVTGGPSGNPPNGDFAGGNPPSGGPGGSSSGGSSSSGGN